MKNFFLALCLIFIGHASWSQFNVTFRVDMNNVTQTFTTPEVNGQFNNWCGGCAPMSDANNDGIWEITIPLNAGTYEYKFAADTWTIQENLIPGSSCTVTNSGFTNRTITVTQDVVLDVVCWGACVACNAVNPTYNVTFRVDMNNVAQSFTTPEVNGSFNNWCGGCAPMTDANNDGVWELVIALPAGSYEYKFAADTWNIQENLTPGSSCTVTNSGFTNRNITVSGDVVLDAVCWGACVSCNTVVPQYNVTFRVDMNNVTQSFTTPEVNGTFNSWCGGCAPMTDANNDGIWELVVTLPQGSYEYKFAADNWSIQETLTEGASCTVNGAPFVNRSLNVSNDIVLDAVCWGSCQACAPPTYNVTFQVDMNNVTSAFTTPEVNGTFNSWCGGCAPMTDANNDGIWELVIALPAGNYEYKFAADTWNIQETLTQGASCTVGGAPFVNRALNVTGDVVLDVVCWGACVGCNAVIPEYDVTFRVNMNSVTSGFTTPEVNGTFNSWCGGCAPMTDANNDGIWELVITLQQGTYEYKFAADTWNIQETLTEGAPCTINGAPFVNRPLNVTGDVVLDAVCWGSCSEGSLVLYADNDGDGFGAGTSRIFCSAPASGYSALNTDCNDNNASVYPGATELCNNSIDDDCDGSVNEGCLPAPANDNRASASLLTGNSFPACGTTNGNLASATNSTEATSVEPSGAGQDVWYRFVAQTNGVRIQATNNSGLNDLVIELQNSAGTTTLGVENETTTGNEIMVMNNLVPGQTYFVAVRNFNTSTRGAFTVCIQHLTASQPNNGTSFSSLCGYIKSKWNGASLYTVTFNDGSNAPISASGTSTQIPFSQLSGVRYNTTYNVTFTSTFNINDAAGNPTTVVVNSAPYVINILQHQVVELRSLDRCPNSRLLKDYITTTGTICGSNGFQWEVELVDENNIPIGIEGPVSVNTTSRYLKVIQIPGVQTGQRYRVRVRPTFSYGTGIYAPGYQYLCIAGSTSMVNYQDQEVVNFERSFTVNNIATNLYPNPSNGEYVNVSISSLEGLLTNIRIYDNVGKIVYQNSFYSEDGLNALISFERALAPGLYTMEIINGSTRQSHKMMIK